MVAYSTGVTTNIAPSTNVIKNSTAVTFTAYPSMKPATEVTINIAPRIQQGTQLVLNTFSSKRGVSTPMILNIFTGSEAYSTALSSNVAVRRRLNTLLRFNTPTSNRFSTQVYAKFARKGSPGLTLIGFKILTKSIKTTSTRIMFALREKVKTPYTQIILNISLPGKVYNPIFKSFYEPGDCGCT